MMDEREMALPKLFGAPAYRPPRRVPESVRPFDPDELPITAQRTDDERELVESLPEKAFAPGGGVVLGAEHPSEPSEPAEPERSTLGRLFGRN